MTERPYETTVPDDVTVGPGSSSTEDSVYTSASTSPSRRAPMAARLSGPRRSPSRPMRQTAAGTSRRPQPRAPRTSCRRPPPSCASSSSRYAVSSTTRHRPRDSAPWVDSGRSRTSCVRWPRAPRSRVSRGGRGTGGSPRELRRRLDREPPAGGHDRGAALPRAASARRLPARRCGARRRRGTTDPWADRRRQWQLRHPGVAAVGEQCRSRDDAARHGRSCAGNGATVRVSRAGRALHGGRARQ